MKEPVKNSRTNACGRCGHVHAGMNCDQKRALKRYYVQFARKTYFERRVTATQGSDKGRVADFMRSTGQKSVKALSGAKNRVTVGKGKKSGND